MEKSQQQKTLAQIISVVLHPGIMLGILSLVFIRHTGVSPEDFVRAISPTVVVVMSYLFTVVFILKLVDIDFTDVKKRPPFLIVSVVGFFISLLVAKQIAPELEIVFVKMLLILLFITSISFYWKVSMHSTSFTTAILALAYFESPIFLLGLLLLPLLYWARIHLHKHKLGQLLVGSFLSLIIIF